MTQDEIYLAKCERACKELYAMREQIPFTQLIVYGSLARGMLGMTSDIDIMLLVPTDATGITKVREKFKHLIPPYFEDEFPYVDVRIARVEAYEAPENSEYGKFLENCRRDGITIWKA